MLSVNPETSLSPRVAVWMLVQLGALALSMGRVALAARFPIDTERWAVHEMLAVQFLTSATLFPWLLGSIAAALAIVLTSIPMLLLAALAADVSTSVLLLPCVIFVLWILTLAGWLAVVRNGPMQTTAIALALLMSAGAVCLHYFAIEFGGTRADLAERIAAHSPMLYSMRALQEDALQWSKVATAAMLSASGWAWAAAKLHK